MTNKRVVGILAHGSIRGGNIGSLPTALVPSLRDSFMNRLPWFIVSDNAVIDGVPVRACCIGFDRTDLFNNPRRFLAWVDARGDWVVEGYFGWDGSQKQATEFLKVLEDIGIEKVTAFGPTNKDHWYEESISPADLIKALETESADAIVAGVTNG